MRTVKHSETEPEVISRITDLLIAQHKSQAELLKHLGLHPNNFTEWKAKRKRSYLLYIDQIARFLNVSPTYLLRGEQETSESQLPQDEVEMLALYRQLDAKTQIKLMAEMKKIVKEEQEA